MYLQTQRIVRIPIVNDMEFEKDENFEVELFDPEGGAKIGKVCRTAVTITNDDGEPSRKDDAGAVGVGWGWGWGAG
jgi:hypothetical protein